MTIGSLAQTSPNEVATDRLAAIDTMRGIAILMVIGIHSLDLAHHPAWAVMLDAALRPCVAVFLFASGYLTARTGRVPLGKRIKTAVIPYSFAFLAAYAYMAVQNPAMDHRPWVAAVRYLLGYVLVYYFVFIYVGCTILLWSALKIAGHGPAQRERIGLLLVILIAFGLVAGAYLDPLLQARGLSESLIEEARLRDIPFWFTFMALGLLVGLHEEHALRECRGILTAAAILAYALYALVRVNALGDAAGYDSIAFFTYAALLCLALLAWAPHTAALGLIGSGSYFIYLWHIFVIMALKDHMGSADGPSAMMLRFAAAATASIAGLLIVRSLNPRGARLVGA